VGSALGAATSGEVERTGWRPDGRPPLPSGKASVAAQRAVWASHVGSDGSSPRPRLAHASDQVQRPMQRNARDAICTYASIVSTSIPSLPKPQAAGSNPVGRTTTSGLR
jgi:hypothetical protein